MSNAKFTEDLLEQLNESNVLFSAILHLPTLVINSGSEDFSEFIEEVAENNNGEPLVKQLPELNFILENISTDPKGEWAFDHAQEITKVRGDFEFLVRLDVFSYYGFSFTKEGKHQSCTVSNNWSNVWILATDMQHAAVQAIEINDQVFNKAMQKAKVEQGFTKAE